MEIKETFVYGCLLVIGYFLRMIHTEHKVHRKTIDSILLKQVEDRAKLTAIEVALATSHRELTTTTTSLVDVIKELKEEIRKMHDEVVHIDKNATGVKLFFEKYMNIEDMQKELEHRVTIIEAQHNN